MFKSIFSMTATQSFSILFVNLPLSLKTSAQYLSRLSTLISQEFTRKHFLFLDPLVNDFSKHLKT